MWPNSWVLYLFSDVSTGQMQPCGCIVTKQGFPHAPGSVITCRTQRNQALFWTSLPQTHRWDCYYSSLPEFSGKEGMSLWHTSCPLKRPTERRLSRPSFQITALMAAWKETFGVLKQTSVSWTCTHVCNQTSTSVYKPNKYLLLSTSVRNGICSLLSFSRLGNLSKRKEFNSVGTCQTDVGIFKPGLTPT